MLQTKFGIDDGFTEWAQHVKKNDFEKLAEKWNKDNDIKELAGIEYTVIGLRKKIISSIVK